MKFYHKYKINGLISKCFLMGLCLFYIISCQTKTIHYRTPDATEIEKDAKDYNELVKYELNQINLDYHSNCHIVLQLKNEKKSGKCQIIITADNQMNLNIFDPIGRIALDVFMNDKEIQIFNRFENTLYQLVNNYQNRLFLFGMDINLIELRSILWGRKIKHPKNKLQFGQKPRKPVFILKDSIKNKIIIMMKKWLEYKSLYFPKLIIMKEPLLQTIITIAITDFKPGKIKNINELKTNYNNKNIKIIHFLAPIKKTNHPQ